MEGHLLFTAFEPSGDRLGARLIEAIRERGYTGQIHAYGGPQMEKAGANILEHTTQHAAMLLGAAALWKEHHDRRKRLAHWLSENDVTCVIPIDSPAANFPICELARKAKPSAKIVHLVAPQVWAWGQWRVKKMPRLTNHVLCLLPFEPDWFAQHNVPSSYVGHPSFAKFESSDRHAELPETGQGQVKVALLPGSRSSEVKKNWPTMRQVFVRLRESRPNLIGVVAASDDERAELIQQTAGGLADGMSMLVGDSSAVMDWADVGLIVSGTATLETAGRGLPMVVLYNTTRWQWNLYGRWLIATRTFALPNLISQWQGDGHCVQEFVPHFGQVEPVVEALSELIDDPAKREAQKQSLTQVSEPFQSIDFKEVASTKLLEILDAQNSVSRNSG